MSSDTDSIVIIPDYLRKAQENLSAYYRHELVTLEIQARSLSLAEARDLYEGYQAALAEKMARAKARINEQTPAYLDLNQFEVTRIQQQQTEVNLLLEALERGRATSYQIGHSRDFVMDILPADDEPVTPLLPEGTEPSAITIVHSDGTVSRSPFNFNRSKHGTLPPAPRLQRGAIQVSPLPETALPYKDLASTLDHDDIPAGAPLFPVVSRAQGGVSLTVQEALDTLHIEHINMVPTDHGRDDHEAEITENGTARWSEARLAEDEAKIRDAVTRFTGKNLQDFMEQVLNPLRREILTELGRRKEANEGMAPQALSQLNSHLLSHANSLRLLYRQAEEKLKETLPSVSLTRDNDSLPPAPPSAGGRDSVGVKPSETSAPVLAERSISTREEWTLAAMLERGNKLKEAVKDTIDFAKDSKNATLLKELLADELAPEQAAVEGELARRKAAYGSAFDQKTYEEREFHLLQHAKFIGELVSETETEIATLEELAASSSQDHAKARRPAPIPTIAEMIDMRNSIRRGLLEGGTETEFIQSAILGVERALATDPNNAFYKDEMKQLLAFQTEDNQRLELENLQTEEIRAAQKAAASAAAPSLRERLTGVFTRATSSLTETFTKATNSWRESLSLGGLSATVAKYAGAAAVVLSLKGAVSSEANQIEEKSTSLPVAEASAAPTSPLGEAFSRTSQKLRDALSSLRAVRAPLQENAYAKGQEETRTHEPG